MAALPRFFSAAIVAATAFFLSLALVAADEPRWLTAAAACYFLAKTGNRERFFSTLLVFAVLAVFHWWGLLAFHWGALLAGVLLFAALLAEIWTGAHLMKKSASLLTATLCMMALLFAGIPAICFYVEPVLLPPPPLALLAAAIVVLEVLAARKSSARLTLDPLLILLLAALTLCYVLTVALLASSIAYPQAILFAAAGGCIMLVIVSLLSMPLMGGNALTFFQHIFSLHVPVEKWVAEISAAAAKASSPDVFADSVMQQFLSLPGVVGVMWRLDDSDDHSIGTTSKQPVDLQCPPLFIRLYMSRRASPWDWFNYYLLARISGEYCRAKQREEQNRADNLSRAMHQTGARLTHDIKNILHTLTALIQADDDALIRRQLPALHKRLETTMAKLQAPSVATDSRLVDASVWWAAAQARHAHQPVVFSDTSANASASLPAALFDLALDNFLGNALIKRQTDNTVRIQAQLTMVNGKPALQVQDGGAAVAAAAAAVLFRQPVESDTGFGVALYQVELEAKKHQHAITLLDNTSGNVVFQLALATAPPAPSAAR